MAGLQRNLAIGLLTIAAVSGDCNVDVCGVVDPNAVPLEYKTCYTTAVKAMDCLKTFPMNKDWANQNLEVFTKSLENFGFGALYHSTGPPYSISLDIQQELADTKVSVNADEFVTDLDFHEHLQSIFQSTLDAHTRYKKPTCYAATFLQPVAFDIRIDATTSPAAEPSFYFIPSTYAAQYAALYPDVDLTALSGKKITLINGLEPTTEISAWGDTHETRSNNRGVRFNSAVRSYLYREAKSLNIADLDDLKVTFEDGSVATIPWIAAYQDLISDVAFCEAKVAPVASRSHRAIVSPEVAKRSSGNPATHLPHEDLPPTFLHSSLTDDRPDRTVILPTTNKDGVSCFTQTVASADAGVAGVSNVLVMKVATFSPPAEPADQPYEEIWNGFLTSAQTCLSSQYDMIVVDVMANGGGFVCLGLRLIELLVQDYYEDHTKVQMHYDLPHSDLMTEYVRVKNDPNPYPFPQDVESILDPATQTSFVDGNAYYYPGRNVIQGGVASMRTNFFALDCRVAEAMPDNGNFRPKFVTADKLIILTDGTCGSTCASFTKIPQEANKATFVGAGGLWKEEMDVSSFAGGFVCNPGYLSYLSELSNLPAFPTFATDQAWQFGWAAWYSSILPSRPVQFTSQEPNFRESFWAFPHPSVDSATTTAQVSTLYDQIISSSVTRIAAAVPLEPETCDSDSSNENLGLIIACGMLATLLLVMFVMYYQLQSSYNAKGYKNVSVDRGDETDVTRNEPFLQDNVHVQP